MRLLPTGSDCQIQVPRFRCQAFHKQLQVDRTAPATPTSNEKLRIADVHAQISGLEHGAGFVLFVNAGYLDMLEGYSYDEPWPEAADKFELCYTDEPRDVHSLVPRNP